MRTDVKGWPDTETVEVLVTGEGETEKAVIIALSNASRVDAHLQSDGRMLLIFRLKRKESNG